MNDHTPVYSTEINLRKIGGATGKAIPDRPEYGAPLPMSALLQDRHTRGRKLTREEIAAEIADHKSALDRGSASIMCEIAAQLQELLREQETIHSGSFDERLDAISVEMLQSDSNLSRIAGHLVSVALLIMRGDG